MTFRLIAPLLTIDDAAAQLGVPKGSLRAAAEEHGLLVRMGRAVRIDPNDLPELIQLCRNTPKAPACIAGRTPASGSSATPGVGSARQAQEIAEMLKGRSPSTSPNATAAPVVPLARRG